MNIRQSDQPTAATPHVPLAPPRDQQNSKESGAARRPEASRGASPSSAAISQHHVDRLESSGQQKSTTTLVPATSSSEKSVLLSALVDPTAPRIVLAPSTAPQNKNRGLAAKANASPASAGRKKQAPAKDDGHKLAVLEEAAKAPGNKATGTQSDHELSLLFAQALETKGTASFDSNLSALVQSIEQRGRDTGKQKRREVNESATSGNSVRSFLMPSAQPETDPSTSSASASPLKRKKAHTNDAKSKKPLTPAASLFFISPSLAQRVLLHQGCGRHAEAMQELNDALLLQPQNAMALACRGEMIHRIRPQTDEVNDFQQAALSDLNQAISLQPDNAFALACRGDLHRSFGRDTEALGDLNQAIELQPDNAFALNCRAELHLKARRKQETIHDILRITDLQPLIPFTPLNEYALSCRSLLHRAFYQTTQATRELNEILAVQPNHSIALAFRGELNQRSGRPDEAFLDIKRALVSEPRNAYALTIRGELHLANAKGLEAFRDFDQAIVIQPDNFVALGHRGNLNRLLGREREALTDLVKSVKIQPEPNFAAVILQGMLEQSALTNPSVAQSVQQPSA